MAKDKNLDLTIKIIGKLDKSLVSAINQATMQTSSMSRTISKAGTVGLATMAAGAAATAASILKCTNEAQKYEKQMANVVKYVDGLADANGKISDSFATLKSGEKMLTTYRENYEQMKDVLLELSTQIPMTAEDLTKLAAAAGQSGKSMQDLVKYDAKGNITGFLRDAAMAGTAMDIDPGTAGDWAAKWEKSMFSSLTGEEAHKAVMVLMDQINYLGANSATTAAEIATAVNNSASLGQVAGVNPATTAALADAMLATGVSTDRVGTSIKRIYTNINKGASATKAQKETFAEIGMTAEGVAKAMQTDANGTLLQIFESLGNLPKERQIAAMSNLFGQWAIEGGAKVVDNLQVYMDALNMVSDPKKYAGSMEREFIIKSSTGDAIDLMMSNALKRLQINIGDAFLPAKKELSLAMIDAMDGINDQMPQLKEIMGTLADLASGGIRKLGDAFEKALPYIASGLDYIAKNGETVGKVIAGMAGTFAAMKFAPAAEGIIGGAGSLLRGLRKKDKKGILTGWFENAKTTASGAKLGVEMAKNQTLTGTGGGMLNRLFGAFYGAKNSRKLINTSMKDKAWMKVFDGTARQIADAKSGGLIGAFGKTGIGQWMGNIGKAAAGVGQTSVGGSLLNGLKSTGGTAKEILSGIYGATFKDIVDGAGMMGKIGIEAIRAKGTGIVSTVSNNTMGRRAAAFGGKAIGAGGKALSAGGTALGALGSFGGSALNLGTAAIGPAWSLISSGFVGILKTSAPAVTAISAIIAVISILGDHLEDIRQIVGNVFGDKGIAIFDAFTDKISQIGDFINSLFEEGGVAKALAPARDAIENIFGGNDTVLGAFDGMTTVLQSIMGVIGQVVTFATTYVKPIIVEIFRFITGTVIPGILQLFTATAPSIASFVSAIGSTIMSIMTMAAQAIQFAIPYVEGIISTIMSIATVVIPLVIDGFAMFADGIGNIVSDVMGIFNGLIEFITGVFTGNWSKAWEGMKGIFGNAFDALVELCKTPINAVAHIINGVVEKINKMAITIPDWVPEIGGQTFGINLPTLPTFARGGFTSGPSIAGENGSEAVISFDSAYRSQNIKTWLKAGKLLGIGTALKPLGDQPQNKESYIFSPQIIVQGNADRNTIDKTVEELKKLFDLWIREKEKKERRLAY